MKSKYESFDRMRLLIKPPRERHHDYELGHWLKLDEEVLAVSPDQGRV